MKNIFGQDGQDGTNVWRVERREGNRTNIAMVANTLVAERGRTVKTSLFSGGKLIIGQAAIKPFYT